MRIVFMGTPAFALPTLKYCVTHHTVVAVVSQPSKPVGRKRLLTPPPVAQEAVRLGLTLFQPEKINTLYETLQALDIDLIVTAAYGQFLPKRILALPKVDCINVHGSLLPKHRGGAPIQRAIEQGDLETGITIMRMVERMDAGGMFHQERCAIDPKDTSETVFDKLAALGPVALDKAWDKIVKGHPPIIQDETLATYAHTVRPEEEVLDFTLPARVLERKIRAFYPSPATHTYLEGLRLKVYGATALERASEALPGTLLGYHAEGLYVATGEGILALQDLQLEGKKRLPVTAFQSGYPLNSLSAVALQPRRS